MREELSLEHIETAAQVIDPTFLDSPQFVDSQLAAALGRQVLVKVETTNPLGSFKGRGADFLVRDLEPKLSLVCGTAGNFGQGIAYAGRRHGLAVQVFVAASVTPSKLSRMRALDADVTVIEGDEADTKEAARSYAERHAECLSWRTVRIHGSPRAPARSASSCSPRVPSTRWSCRWVTGR